MIVFEYTKHLTTFNVYIAFICGFVSENTTQLPTLNFGSTIYIVFEVFNHFFCGIK